MRQALLPQRLWATVYRLALPASHARQKRSLATLEVQRPRHFARKPWTEDEIEKLLQLRASGTPMPEIAEQLSGRSTSSVQQKCSLLINSGRVQRLTRPIRFSKEELDLLVQLRAEGRTFREISSHFIPSKSPGALMSTHHNLVDRQSSSGRATWSSLEDNQLIEHREKDRMTWQEIAERVSGRSRRELRQRYYRIRSLSERVNVEPKFYASDEKLAEIVGLRDQGFSWREIAERIPGASDTDVYSFYQTAVCGTEKERLKNNVCTRRFTEAEDQRLMELHSAGNSSFDIAKSVSGRSASTIRSRLRLLRDEGRHTYPVTKPTRRLRFPGHKKSP